MDIQPFFTNENERFLIQTLRQATANKKRPTTFVIRVVDGIIQFMIAEPAKPSKISDICHVDQRNGNR